MPPKVAVMTIRCPKCGRFTKIDNGLRVCLNKSHMPILIVGETLNVVTGVRGCLYVYFLALEPGVIP